MKRTIKNTALTVAATIVAPLAFYVGIPTVMRYAMQTPVDYQGSRYFVRQTEERTTVNEASNMFRKISLIDSNNDGEVDEVLDQRRVPSRGALFLLNRYRDPTEREQELFEGVLGKIE